MFCRAYENYHISENNMSSAAVIANLFLHVFAHEAPNEKPSWRKGAHEAGTIRLEKPPALRRISPFWAVIRRFCLGALKAV